MRSILWLFLLTSTLSTQAQLPTDFYDEVVTAEFSRPIGIVWDHEETMYVWEKSGLVWRVGSDGVTENEPLVDIREEVADWRDHGLMGLALDPNYEENGHLYLLYAADRHYLLHYGTADYHPDTTHAYQPSIGRVTRYTADAATGFSTLVPGSRKILIGETFDSGFPLIHESHGVGSLLFGTDGTLIVSAGDGSSNKGPDTGGTEYESYVPQALADGFLSEAEDIGLYRSQSLLSHAGKLLRIDPATGNGLPSNPYYQTDAPRSAQSRTWVRGLRNPFRFVLQPNTGEHTPEAGDPGVFFVGDVGGNSWEELNIVSAGGQNFGWPITEGHWGYWGISQKPAPANPDAPNPLAGTGCEPFFTYRDLFGRANATAEALPNPCSPLQAIPEEFYPTIETMPALAWSNSRWNQPTRATVARVTDDLEIQRETLDGGNAWVEGDDFDGFASIGGTFYTGEDFPEAYHGAYFHLDYDNWIRVMQFDENNELESVELFHDDVFQTIFLTEHPSDGCLYIVTYSGNIRKICYGGNPLPVVHIEADTTYGPQQLTVQFDGSESYAPFGHPVEFQWDFGDGTNSTEIAPTHTFSTTGNAPKTFTVTLTVTDTTETANSATAIISLNNTPPEIQILGLNDGDRYPMEYTHILPLRAQVTDAEHPGAELRYEWQTYLHHNLHFHKEKPDTLRETIAVISPNGCSGEDYWYRIRLRVTDAGGLSSEQELSIYPNCEGFAELPELSAAANAEGVQLDWQLPAGLDWTDYELQRSTDRVHFAPILNNDSASGRNHFDANPPRGTLSYRLWYRDAAQNYGFTPEVIVQYPVRPEVYVYPNPTGGNVRLFLENPSSERISMDIYDALGRSVSELTWEHNGGAFEKTVVTAALEPGIYFWRVTDGAAEVRGSLVRR